MPFRDLGADVREVIGVQGEGEERSESDQQCPHGRGCYYSSSIREPLDRLTALIFAAAAAIRIAVNNVAVYSRADETIYLLYAKSGYPQIVRMYLADPKLWLFPHPLRWSWIGVTSLACFDCTHRTLATISTIAGIAVVALTFWIARELFGSTTALVATVLAATSPLQLALSRRALSDEFVCAAVLASIAALLQYLRGAAGFSPPNVSGGLKPAAPRIAWLFAWIAATTIALASKELFLFSYPLLLGFWWLRARKLRWYEAAAWLAPPFLFFAVFSILAGDVSSFFEIARLTASTVNAAYPAQYQSGPPHRLLIDLLAVAPVVTIFAVAGVVSLRRHPFALLALAMFALHALLPSQNLRYIAPVEPMLRIVAAAFLTAEFRDRRWLGGLLLANAAIEWMLFSTIFIRGQVYDPVTDHLLRALKMLPR
ncbi:MAG TPA: glycosyltransferase family 39 protein [Thermoanaerobaculia bacterium]|nr:glycosyltransferase family 39 protein [Thermoanaerobaculia bacterium]